jgi:hypothetical protein
MAKLDAGHLQRQPYLNVSPILYLSSSLTDNLNTCV